MKNKHDIKGKIIQLVIISNGKYGMALHEKILRCYSIFFE